VHASPWDERHGHHLAVAAGGIDGAGKNAAEAVTLFFAASHRGESSGGLQELKFSVRSCTLKVGPRFDALRTVFQNPSSDTLTPKAFASRRR